MSLGRPAPDHPADGPSFRLVLLRHGQSEWNAQNRFTGWANPALTEAGEREAVRAGQLLYCLGRDMRPLTKGGRYLEPQPARKEMP